MFDFPRTTVGGLSMPRLICGSNWLLGYSHTSQAKDRFLKEYFDTPQKVADIIEVFARNGCNAFMSMPNPFVYEALNEVEQRTGVHVIHVATPGYAEDGNPDSWKKSVDYAKKMGAEFCFPHQCVTDPRLDRVNRCLTPELMDHLRIVREAGMIPGLSTHAPESVTYSDLCGADVETYIQPYNAAGFLCQVETDWVQNIINNAKKPVMTIKPLAAGRLLPPTGLAFAWNTIRDIDMVTIGTMSTYEAEEVIEISRACLERRKADVELQTTRSKKNL
ncbi:MAG: aldo-keto reductase family protein [Armatimonadota bacterium]